MSRGLAWYARRVLTAADPSEKVRLTQEAAEQWASSRTIGEAAQPPVRPARPVRPLIVTSGKMPSVKEVNAPTNIYYLHGLAHVELNAIDLCFDTMIRFADDTGSEIEDAHDWYADWISIASDEARHFSWLDKRLRDLGSCYGDLPAHGIIWNSADVSKGCRKERLALGQLVAEAKGLDAGPRLADRLTGAGDIPSADMVRVIADEELEHVRIGVKWFIRECEREKRDPIAEFQEIALRLSNPGAFAPPFNEERRRQAGLDPEWYLPVAEQMKKQCRERREEAKLAGKKSTQGVGAASAVS
ncbi:unnamed protein product [Chondrus crispus]|uniref:Ferritin-like domain-containing protein n=1 Tax=Chondrus crispus TaxID=2769 RepID=R7QB03_CHOCR|nr:unnamed protein product [Chondrus crispus]CDF34953.1 unnamed protein product [Chondrus crispus]|eukprot:XP_005714772.1 unnamed protein product [Chondrus crispus]